MLDNVLTKKATDAIKGYYYIVDQILAKGLHTADDECMTYTTTLMDKLEQVKADQAGNDAITDDVAAKAYIEQFALETFQRGDDAIHSNKASKYVIHSVVLGRVDIDLPQTNNRHLSGCCNIL